ncbi:MAG: hypothetical protein KF817_04930 [Phycisphaeraceae bacterium]|nr:hypothetical protein [Phycisphaeraceae bacterium]
MIARPEGEGVHGAMLRCIVRIADSCMRVRARSLDLSHSVHACTPMSAAVFFAAERLLPTHATGRRPGRAEPQRPERSDTRGCVQTNSAG